MFPFGALLESDSESWTGEALVTVAKAVVDFLIAHFMRMLALVCLAIVVGSVGVLPAHTQEQTGRKLVTHVQPKYPEYLRQHEIGGSVRLTVVVTPNGNVKNVTPIGGNPILVDAAIDAVKQWKYVPSENTETFEVRVEFAPHKQ